MNIQNKIRLQQLRATLKTKLEAQTFFEKQIEPFKEIFSSLQELNVLFKVVDLIGVDDMWLPYLKKELHEFPFTDLENDCGKSVEAALLSQLFTVYPSTNPLRYVPPIPKIEVPKDSKSGLKMCINAINVANQEVYIYYLQYAPLLEIALLDLTVCDNEGLFNFWYGDVVIFPKDLSWLIAHSLEETWYAGRLKV